MIEGSFDLPDIDWFTTGTVGEPGQRTFFIQAGAGATIVTLKVEKQQIAALADYLENMLTDLATPDEVDPAPELDTPIEHEWAVASMGVAYFESRDRIALWAEQLTRDEDATPATCRFQLTRAQVSAFIDRSRGLVAAGRPPCPYCAMPLNEPEWCPCFN